MFLIDDLLTLPVKGFLGIFKKIHEMAEQELSDENVSPGKADGFEFRFELDEINGRSSIIGRKKNFWHVWTPQEALMKRKKRRCEDG